MQTEKKYEKFSESAIKKAMKLAAAELRKEKAREARKVSIIHSSIHIFFFKKSSHLDIHMPGSGFNRSLPLIVK